MPVPDYQSLMHPVLRVLSDGTAKSVSGIRDEVAGLLRLSTDDLRELTPSAKKPLFHDRIAWALTYLSQAALLSRPKRGVYELTARGADVLRRHPSRVDNAVLEQFSEFENFLARSTQGARTKADQKDAAEDPDTPEESLDAAYRRLRATMEADLLQQVKAASSGFFERLVVELLVAMGYGGSLNDAGRAIGRSGDGGIDGIIKEDRLGLDVILIQAKRWTGKTVGRPDAQAFAGSLEGVRARKGIFITTSSFSADARDYVERIDKRIVLVDGERLVSLMFDFGIGVSTTATYEVKRVDSDYFGEE